MKTLLALLALTLLAAPLRAEDEPKSENEATTVRTPDGKFTKVPLKKDDPGRPQRSPKPDDKPADKPAPSTDVIDAAQVSKLKQMDGQEAKVRGQVHDVFVPNSGNVAVLNMGKDFKTCFKVAIFKANFGKFGGLDEIKKLKGKTVTVEGRVAMYQNLPQIVAAVPSQLKTGE